MSVFENFKKKKKKLRKQPRKQFQQLSYYLFNFIILLKLIFAASILGLYLRPKICENISDITLFLVQNLYFSFIFFLSILLEKMDLNYEYGLNRKSYTFCGTYKYISSIKNFFKLMKVNLLKMLLIY